MQHTEELAWESLEALVPSFPILDSLLLQWRLWLRPTQIPNWRSCEPDIPKDIILKARDNPVSLTHIRRSYGGFIYLRRQKYHTW